MEIRKSRLWIWITPLDREDAIVVEVLQHVSTHHAVIVVVVSRSIVHRIQCGPVWEVVLGGGQSPSNGRQQVFEFHE